VRDCEAFVIVFSLTSRASFEQARMMRNHVARVKDRDDMPIVLAGNKADLEEARAVSTQEATEVCLN
jgi:Ras-related protein R-Ras2